MPRATVEPPIVYSRISAQPINHATLQEEPNIQRVVESETTRNFKVTEKVKWSVTLHQCKCKNSDRHSQLRENDSRVLHSKTQKVLQRLQLLGRKRREQVLNALSPLFPQECKPLPQLLIQHLQLLPPEELLRFSEEHNQIQIFTMQKIYHSVHKDYDYEWKLQTFDS